MTFSTVTAYKCDTCGRVYAVQPTLCSCLCIKIVPGMVINSFLIKGLTQEDECLAQCLLCGFVSEQRISDLRTKSSCGCRPKHIEILEITKDTIKYRCKLCRLTHFSNTPVVEYCCGNH